MGTWPKHPKKEHQEALEVISEHGWRIERNPRGYYKIKCPCGAHSRSYHLSPSGAYFANHVLQWCSKCPTWSGKEPDA